MNTNANAVNFLANPTDETPKNHGQLLQYYVNGRLIIHVYDPSHLIKTVRNNLQTKNLDHTITKRWTHGDTNATNVEPVAQTASNVEPIIKTASWDHIYALYEMDTQSTQRLLPKLTDQHLTPTKYKMRVSVATQVFSTTCGTVMLQCIQDKKLPVNFDGTAQILLFMNDVFDSINGSKDYDKSCLKSAVQSNSVHFSFWKYALSMLSKMNFVNKVDGKINNGSSVIKKLEATIRGYMAISKICFDLDIPQVPIRYPLFKNFIYNCLFQQSVIFLNLAFFGFFGNVDFKLFLHKTKTTLHILHNTT